MGTPVERRVAHIWRRLGFGPTGTDIDKGVAAGPVAPAHRINDALIPTVDFRSVYATVLNRLAGDANTGATVLKGPFADLGVFKAPQVPAGGGSTTTTTVAPPGTTPTTSTTLVRR